MQTRLPSFDAKAFDAKALQELNENDQARWLDSIEIKNYEDLKLIASALNPRLATLLMIENSHRFPSMQEIYEHLRPLNLDENQHIEFNLKYAEILKKKFFANMIDSDKSFISALQQITASEIKWQFIKDFYRPEFKAAILIKAIKTLPQTDWFGFITTFKPTIEDCETLFAYYEMLPDHQRYAFVKPYIHLIQTFDEAIQFNFTGCRKDLTYFNDVEKRIETADQFIKFAKHMNYGCYREAAKSKRHLFDEKNSLLALIKNAPDQERLHIAEDFMREIRELKIVKEVCHTMIFQSESDTFERLINQTHPLTNQQRFFQVPNKKEEPQKINLKRSASNF